jgi:trigger factor
VEADRAAAEGDTVNINYKGLQDGVEFAGGSAEDQDLKLGSGKMIDGFEDGIIGMKKGETKTLDLTFPEDYAQEALAGQPASFEITVNSVKEEQEAVLDDEFVQSVSEYQTVAEYKESIRESLMTQKKQAADYEIQQTVLQTVIDGAQIKLSKNAVSKRYNNSLELYKQQAKMYGMSLSQMAQAYGMDEPALKEQIYAGAEEDATTQLVLDTIAAQENMTLEDTDRQYFAQMSGQTLEDAVAYYGQETLDNMALNYKVMTFLADNADNETGYKPVREPLAEVEAEETEATENSEAAETEAAETEAAETEAAETEAGSKAN